jgi:dTDP-4-dehydrorhamnose 3,5-epimerase
MRLIETDLEGVLIVEPDVYGDHRGYFMETYNRKRYDSYGIMREFVQDNMSFSSKGTLRGLHYQLNRPQAKLIQVLKGEVYDVAVDVRIGSPSFGRWVGVTLSETNKKQLFVPEGFAHGFCVVSDSALFLYKCSDFYCPVDEQGILWSDPFLGIPWPVVNPLLSEKDKTYVSLQQTDIEKLPLYIR